MTETADPDERARALADRYYGHLLTAGRQGLALNPLVYVTAPSRALVLWGAPGRVLEGYAVSKIDWHNAYYNSELESMGFDEEAQRAGLWVLRGARYEPRTPGSPDGWRESAPPDGLHLFANYDPVAKRWRVVRRKPGQPPPVPWLGKWQPMSGDLATVERAVIARTGRETEMLRDAAATLRDDPAAHAALRRILMQRARESPDPDDERRIGAIVRPLQYLPPAVSGLFQVSALGGDLAGPLYRALAGRRPRDSSAVGAVATVTEATLCPPYEPVAFGLSRGPGRPPPGTTAQDRRPAQSGPTAPSPENVTSDERRGT